LEGSRLNCITRQTRRPSNMCFKLHVSRLLSRRSMFAGTLIFGFRLKVEAYTTTTDVRFQQFLYFVLSVNTTIYESIQNVFALRSCIYGTTCFDPYWDIIRCYFVLYSAFITNMDPYCKVIFVFDIALLQDLQSRSLN
jgi:hypothetical protein